MIGGSRLQQHEPATDGFVAAGFQEVHDEFRRNFTDRGEVGASFAVMVDGEVVADLWGGLADRHTERPWRADTLQLIFSGTKGIVAICILMLMDRGAIDPEAPVVRYWPAFATGGKQGVLVKEVLSHQARLPGLRCQVKEADIVDAEAMAALLASQALEPDPRAQDAYHPLTYGWLCGELIRRVDGRSVGRFIDEEIAAPLGLELWLGLPDAREERVSALSYGQDWGAKLHTEADYAADPLLARVWNNPQLFPADHIPWNTKLFHASEIPGAGCIGTARSLARLYGCLARGGELDGVRLVSEAAIRHGRQCLARRRDSLLDEPAAYGLGFELQTELLRFGTPPAAFGHSGAGGSIHGAWPHERVGYSYCMNEMRDHEPVDARPKALLGALHNALRRRGRRPTLQ